MAQLHEYLLGPLWTLALHATAVGQSLVETALLPLGPACSWNSKAERLATPCGQYEAGIEDTPVQKHWVSLGVSREPRALSPTWGWQPLAPSLPGSPSLGSCSPWLSRNTRHGRSPCAPITAGLGAPRMAATLPSGSRARPGPSRVLGGPPWGVQGLCTQPNSASVDPSQPSGMHIPHDGSCVLLRRPCCAAPEHSI